MDSRLRGKDVFLDYIEIRTQKSPRNQSDLSQVGWVSTPCVTQHV